jgi:hypothetical protein
MSSCNDHCLGIKIAWLVAPGKLGQMLLPDLKLAFMCSCVSFFNSTAFEPTVSKTADFDSLVLLSGQKYRNF